MVTGSDFLPVDFLAVDGPPRIDDISQNDRNDKTDIRHSAQRELAAATIGDGQAALQIGI